MYSFIDQPAGSGTEQDPYLIGSVDNLLWVSAQSSHNDHAFDGQFFIV